MRHAKTQEFARLLRQNMTKAETIVWKHLKGFKIEGVKFRRQHPIPPFIADFASIELKLIIEIDGATHSSHKEIENDEARTSFLENSGWEIIRIWNIDIYNNLDGVLKFVSKRVFELNLIATAPSVSFADTSPALQGRTNKEAK